MAFVNQHSFVLMATGFILLVAFLALRGGPDVRGLLALTVVVLALGLTYLMLRPEAQDHSRQLVDQAIGAGKPVLLVFQSPY